MRFNNYNMCKIPIYPFSPPVQGIKQTKQNIRQPLALIAAATAPDPVAEPGTLHS